MSVGKFIVVIVVLGLITAGVLQYFKIYTFIPTADVPSPSSGTPAKADPYDAANTDFMAFKYDVAVNEYKKALEDDPQSANVANAMYRIGKCYDELKKWPEAIAAYKDYIDKFPNDIHAREANQRKELIESGGVK